MKLKIGDSYIDKEGRKLKYLGTCQEAGHDVGPGHNWHRFEIQNLNKKTIYYMLPQNFDKMFKDKTHPNTNIFK